MKLDRRQWLALGGMWLASPGLKLRRLLPPPDATLDLLLAAHASGLPERAGAGANHYPMAAEALEALAREDSIPADWSGDGAALYAGPLPRRGALEDPAGALGNYGRYGDWLDHFRRQLAENSWRTVVARWAPILAPGMAGATFHGLLRTAHATRGLRRAESEARLQELAIGLAYWASRYTELPVAPATAGAATEADPPRAVHEVLASLEYRWQDDRDDVDFDAVLDRITTAHLAPPVHLETAPGSARDQLDGLVRDTAAGFLEMLILERHRIWLLHTVTGPAAVGLLLPEVDARGAQALVAYARQAAVALFAAYGAPFTARAHLRAAPPAWPTLHRRAATSGSVHTIKLIEALSRFRGIDDLLTRSVAVQWLEWT